MRTKRNVFLLVLAVLMVVLSFSQVNAAELSKAERDASMEWFREGRFGMFIHWGLYSVLGGEWKGQDYGKWVKGQDMKLIGEHKSAEEARKEAKERAGKSK